MYQGVIINMNNSNALITVAMLQTFRGTDKDYFDLLTPYVNQIISKQTDLIDIQSIQQQLESDFGILNMSIGTIKIILDRLVKLKILQKDKNLYRIIGDIDTSIYESKKIKIEKIIDDVCHDIQMFYQENTFIKISTDEVQKKLIRFLESHGLSLFKNNVQELVKLKKNDNKDNYIIGQYILNKSEKDKDLYDSLVELVKGFFVFNSIYFFTDEQVLTYESKINGTKIFLDVRQILNLLNYNNDAEHSAIDELLSSIRRHGGEIWVFEHTIGEVRGILGRFKNSPCDRFNLTLDNLIRDDWKDYQIQVLIDNLELNLLKENIKIQDVEELVEKAPEDLLREFEKDSFELFLTQEYFRPKTYTISNDVKSILGIHLIRKNVRKRNIENCRAILLSHSLFLADCTSRYLRDRLIDKEINLVISEYDLSSILWLKERTSSTALPSMTLLKLAYSAVNPSDTDLHDFLDGLEKLEATGLVTSQDAFKLRFNKELKVLIANEAKGSSIDSDIIIKVSNAAKARDEELTMELIKKDALIKKMTDETKKRDDEEFKKSNDARIRRKKKAEKWAGKIMRIIRVFLVVVYLFISCAAIWMNYNDLKEIFPKSLAWLLVIPLGVIFINQKVGTIKKFEQYIESKISFRLFCMLDNGED